jgi:hypothetical protein
VQRQHHVVAPARVAEVPVLGDPGVNAIGVVSDGEGTALLHACSIDVAVAQRARCHPLCPVGEPTILGHLGVTKPSGERGE